MAIGPTMTALRSRQLDWDTKRRAVERAVDCGRRQQDGCNVSPTEVRAVPINADCPAILLARYLAALLEVREPVQRFLISIPYFLSA